MLEMLLVFVGTEVILLVFIVVVTIRSKRMDVLSGRYFDDHSQPVVPDSDSELSEREQTARQKEMRPVPLDKKLPRLQNSETSPARSWALWRSYIGGLTTDRVPASTNRPQVLR